MSDAFIEFLTENSERRYPFAEDSTLVDQSTAFTVKDGVVLDFRGFHRTRPETSPRLAAIVGPSASADSNHPAVAGCWTLYFEMGPTAAPTRLAFPVPTSTAEWPLTLSAAIADPNYAGVKLAGAAVSIGQDIVGLIGDSDRFLFGSTAFLEAATVAQLYRTQVDFLKIIHEEGDPEFVGGDVVMVGGYNFQILQQNGAILLQPDLGAGELGRFAGTINPTSVCNGLLTTLNAQPGTAGGNFLITGSNGIKVVNLPDQNKIQLQIQRASMASPVCV